MAFKRSKIIEDLLMFSAFGLSMKSNLLKFLTFKALNCNRMDSKLVRIISGLEKSANLSCSSFVYKR